MHGLNPLGKTSRVRTVDVVVYLCQVTVTASVALAPTQCIPVRSFKEYFIIFVIFSCLE